ncbi:hypothetical protein ACJIZ3_021978 [Penstemon smallii]|uniref:Uncharacterized protein n=1 Tax=Penstemon smallii TaxID=265156 RepID=A0ABD3SN07_9LAMI
MIKNIWWSLFCRKNNVREEDYAYRLLLTKCSMFMLCITRILCFHNRETMAAQRKNIYFSTNVSDELLKEQEQIAAEVLCKMAIVAPQIHLQFGEGSYPVP